MGKITPPSYTQMPNEVLDNMHRMSQAEFCIIMAICRKTFGWHKEEDRISLSQFVAMTGMSLPTVRHGIDAAVYNGWVVKIETPAGFVYRLNLAMKESLPPSSDAMQDSLPLAMQDSLPTKETITKETTKETGTKERGASAPCAPHPVAFLKRITGRTPKRQLHEILTDAIGAHPDETRLVECWVEWISRDYNPNNYAWVLEWYKNGIPARGSKRQADNSHGATVNPDGSMYV